MKDVDFFTPGARLALELECLLMDTRNDATKSRWWDSAHEALEQWRQAVRDMEASIDAVQPEASTTVEQAESHAHICAKLAEEHKDDALLFAALTDAAAIIRDLLRGRLQASQAHHDLRKWAETSWNRGFQQGLEANRLLAMQAAEALRKEREAHAETNRAMTDALLMMEEREQRDEALLRQALERLEAVVEHFEPYKGDNECRPMENARITIAILRDRLWKKV